MALFKLDVISLSFVSDTEPTKSQPLHLTKLGARAVVTVTYAYLAALAVTYYVPETAKTIVLFATMPVMGLVYWRFWSWVMSLRRRKK